jgi:putative transposase
MDTVNRKIRLYPSKDQETRLAEMLGIHCRTYNALLEEHVYRYEAGLPYFDFAAMCKSINNWRSYAPSLECLNAQSLQVTAIRVHLAFASFFRRLAEGAEAPGYPWFKSFFRYPGWGMQLKLDMLFEKPNLAPLIHGSVFPRLHEYLEA